MQKNMAGIHPAVVKQYDATKRLCRVEIPGLTDGGDVLPEAQIQYPIGDRSAQTEIEVLPGDKVWVMFIGGDPRYPLITGYRNPETGNSTGTRRTHHANIHTAADGTLTLAATNIVFTGNAQFSGGSLTHNGKNVGGDHLHDGAQPGSGNTGQPI